MLYKLRTLLITICVLSSFVFAKDIRLTKGWNLVYLNNQDLSKFRSYGLNLSSNNNIDLIWVYNTNHQNKWTCYVKKNCKDLSDLSLNQPLWIHSTNNNTIKDNTKYGSSTLNTSEVRLYNGYNFIQALSRSDIKDTRVHINNLKYYLSQKLHLRVDSKSINIKIFLFDNIEKIWSISNNGFSTNKNIIRKISTTDGLWIYVDGIKNSTKRFDLDDFIKDNGTPARRIDEYNIYTLYENLHNLTQSYSKSTQLMQANLGKNNFPNLSLNEKISLNESLSLIIQLIKSKENISTNTILKDMANVMYGNLSTFRDINKNTLFSDVSLERLFQKYQKVDNKYSTPVNLALSSISNIKTANADEDTMSAIKSSIAISTKILKSNTPKVSSNVISVIDIKELITNISRNDKNLHYQIVNNFTKDENIKELEKSHKDILQRLQKVGIPSYKITDKLIQNIISKKNLSKNDLSTLAGVSPNTIKNVTFQTVVTTNPSKITTPTNPTTRYSGGGGSSGGGSSGGGSSGGSSGGGSSGGGSSGGGSSGGGSSGGGSSDPQVDTNAPTLSFSINNGSTKIKLDSNITITFSKALEENTTSHPPITNANTYVKFTKNTNTGTAQTFTTTIDSTKKIITIDPSSNLDSGITYFVTFLAYKVQDSTGNTIEQNTTISFTTLVQTPKNIHLDSASDTGIKSDDNITNNQTPTIKWDTLLDVTNYKISIDDGLTWSDVSNNQYTTPTLSDGIYKIKLKSIVGTILSDNYISMQFEIDATKPKLLPFKFDSSSLGQVKITANIKINFDSKIDIETIKIANIVLEDTSSISGTLSNISDTSFIFTPNSDLKYITNYTFTISNIKDVAGNDLDTYTPMKFTTRSPTSVDAPTNFKMDASSDSGINDDNITNETKPKFIWDEVIDATDYNITFDNKITWIKVDSTNQEYTITNDLSQNKEYTVELRANIGSTNSMSVFYKFIFDNIAPKSTTIPLKDSINIDINSKIKISFNEKVGIASLTTTNIKLNGITSTITTTDTQAILTLDSSMNYNKNYTITINNIKDISGNEQTTQKDISFTTGSPDTIPSVTSLKLVDASGNDIDSNKTTETNASFKWDIVSVNNTDIDEYNITITNHSNINITEKNNSNSGHTFFSNLDDGKYDVEVIATSGTTKSLPTEIKIEIDNTKPKVEHILFVDNAPIDIDKSITAVFSEEIDTTTAIPANIKITNDLLATLTPKNNLLTTKNIADTTGEQTSRTYMYFEPSINMEYFSTHTVVIKTGIKDGAGNDLFAEFNDTFTTQSPPSVNQPTLLKMKDASFSGIKTEDNITNKTQIEFQWNRVVQYNRTLKDYNISIYRVQDIENTEKIWIHAIDTQAEGNYTTQTLEEGIYTIDLRAVLGETQSQIVDINFTIDLTPPAIQTIYPVDNFDTFLIDKNITITFNEDIDNTTLTEIKLKKGSTTIGTNITNENNTTITIDPNANLTTNTNYEIQLKVKDIAGNEAILSTSFKTENP